MKRNGILTGLIAACAVCVISITSYSQTSLRSNKPTAAIESSIDIYSASLGFDIKPAAGEITSGRARALVGAVMGLISLVVGGVAVARSSGRALAIAALLLGLIGMILSVVHLGTSTGGFGTGGGRAGAIVGLVLSLIGTSLGGLALARSRRTD